MAIKSASVAVGITATPLTNTGDFDGQSLAEVVIDADGGISVGGAAVTVAGGVRVPLNGIQKFTIKGDDVLYAIGAVPTTARVVVAPRYE